MTQNAKSYALCGEEDGAYAANFQSEMSLVPKFLSLLRHLGDFR